MMHSSINPTNNERIADYALHSDEAMRTMVAHARATSNRWRHSSFDERKILMQKLAHELRQHEERAALLMALEMGKVVSQGRAEIQKCAITCEYFASEAATMLADIPIPSEYKRSYVRFEALGVVLAIMPWNFPFWQVIRAAAPTLMAGNCMVLKHAPEVTGCALLLQQLFDRAGFEPGIFTTVIANVDQTKRLIAHQGIQAVTFTGSSRAGRVVAAEAGRHIKKCVIELGGSDAYCVLDDCDVQEAARLCAASRLINSGQSCVSAKRFIVMKSVLAEFEQAMVHYCSQAIVGDPLDERTQLGPLARVDLCENLQAQVHSSIEQGASVLLDGGMTGVGAFFRPMVLSHVRKGMPAYDEELFGPVASIIAVEDEEELIHCANDTIYGLGAAVFSRDSSRSERIALNLDAGLCFVNDFVKSDPRFPFGGVKDSGWGRELSVFGIREFVNVKSVVIA